MMEGSSGGEIELHQRTSLSDLPDEILDHILSLVSPYRDFKSAMLVCKRWHKIMQGTVSSGTNQGGLLSPKLFKKLLDDTRDFLTTECGNVINEEPSWFMPWADDFIVLENKQTNMSATPEAGGLAVFCQK